MSFRKVLKAAFTIKNFTLLSGVLIISYVTEYLPFLLIGFAGYIYFTLQTLQSEKFKSECQKEDTLAELDRLSRECNVLYNRMSRALDKSLRSKLKDVLQQKDELMRFFSSQKEDPIRQKIVEQALNLVIAYIKLIYNFYMRQRDLSAMDINDISHRLDRNRRKLEFLKDDSAKEELSKAIDMDNELLSEIAAGRKELERIFARLEYIESAINTFKHRIISKDESDPEVDEIESLINEASALDNVLSLNEKMRIRQ